MNTEDKDEFLDDVRNESFSAAEKFPYPNPNLAALMEEVGELAQAMLQNKPWGDIYKEAVQVATMAMRCGLEGDPQFRSMR